MTSCELFYALLDAGARSWQCIREMLEGGEDMMASLGITDEDYEVVNALHTQACERAGFLLR